MPPQTRVAKLNALLEGTHPRRVQRIVAVTVLAPLVDTVKHRL